MINLGPVSESEYTQKTTKKVKLLSLICTLVHSSFKVDTINFSHLHYLFSLLSDS